MSLSEKHCTACEGGIPALNGSAIESYVSELQGWGVVQDHHLSKSYMFPNFKTALEFVNRIGEIAEQEGHHPDLSLSWGKVGVISYTHAVNGLTENDFILAAKIDRLLEKEPASAGEAVRTANSGSPGT